MSFKDKKISCKYLFCNSKLSLGHLLIIYGDRNLEPDLNQYDEFAAGH
jgi:hypothetical protein